MAVASGLAALLAAVLVVGPARAALPSNCSETAGVVTCGFGFTGGAQAWTVPAGVTSATFDVFGSQGGGANISEGGAGGEAKATVAVTPGDPIEILVGGAGAPTGGGAGAGGFNGGAAGGAPGTGSFAAAGGGGGGGASDVRTGTCAGTLSCGLAARVLVGGGGGGSVAAGGAYNGQGGGGGNPSGGAGASAGGAAGGGGGGGQNAGGSAGSGDTSCSSANGGAGGVTSQDAGGAGGDGANDPSFPGYGGGGGGGGYWGGGGGGGGCPTGVSGAGGGGSSFGPSGATFTNATRSGDGQVAVSYAAPTASITTPADGGSYVFGQPVTSSFTCTDVSGGPGIQTCLDQNGNPSGSPVDTSTVGTHTFTVTATDRNGLAGQGTATYTVNQADTSTAVTSSVNPSVFGQSVRFTATVGSVAPGAGTPTGTVTFFDGGSSIGTGTLSGGVASFTTSGLVVGSHAITASYGGDGDFNGSSGSLSGNPQQVNKADTTTTVASSVNPSVFGQSVRFTATVGSVAPGAGTPTGTVTFFDGGSSIGTGTLSGGVASFTTSGLAVGNHAITASYGGDGDFNGSTGSLSGNPQAITGSPSAQIAFPADNQAFNLNQAVSTVFSCTEAPGGPGLSQCVDSGGASGGSGQLDTSTTGAHSYTVTAASKDGLTATATIRYTVIGPPSAQIASPADGASYAPGQVVAASYGCTEAAGGPGIQSCAGTVAAGAPIDTTEPGQHTFTVTAISNDGQHAALTFHYTVVPASNQFAVRHVKVGRNGIVQFDVELPGAGQLVVLETAWKPSRHARAAADLLRPGPGRYVFARRRLAIEQAETLHVKLSLSARARRQVRHHRRPLRINLWITYQPAGGTPRNAAFFGLLVAR